MAAKVWLNHTPPVTPSQPPFHKNTSRRGVAPFGGANTPCWLVPRNGRNFQGASTPPCPLGEAIRRPRAGDQHDNNNCIYGAVVRHAKPGHSVQKRASSRVDREWSNGVHLLVPASGLCEATRCDAMRCGAVRWLFCSTTLRVSLMVLAHPSSLCSPARWNGTRQRTKVGPGSLPISCSQRKGTPASDGKKTSALPDV